MLRRIGDAVARNTVFWVFFALLVPLIVGGYFPGSVKDCSRWLAGLVIALCALSAFCMPALARRDLETFRSRTSFVFRILPVPALVRLRDAVSFFLEGRNDDAKALFGALESAESNPLVCWTSRVVRLSMLVTLGHWSELADEPVDLDPAEHHWLQILCRMLVVRGLAETGRLPEAGALAERVLAGLEGTGWQAFPPVLRQLIAPSMLAVTALSGDETRLEPLLSLAWLQRRNPALRARSSYWRLRCALVRGDRSAAATHAREALALTGGKPPLEWGWDLAWMEKLPVTETPSRMTGDASISRILERLDSLPLLFGMFRPSPAAWSMALVIVVVAATGSVRWDGSECPQFIQGGTCREIAPLAEPHRLITNAFVHLGWLHLANNVTVILTLGAVLEKRVGTARMALLLIAGQVLVELVMRPIALAFDPERSPLQTGASESCGIIVGITLMGLLGEILRGRPDRGVLLPFALSALSALLPRASPTIHVGGLCVGFLLGGLARRQMEERAPGRLTVMVAAALPLVVAGALFAMWTYPLDETSPGYRAFFPTHVHSKLGWTVRLPIFSEVKELDQALDFAEAFDGGMAARVSTIPDASVEAFFTRKWKGIPWHTESYAGQPFYWLLSKGKHLEFWLRPIPGGLLCTCYTVGETEIRSGLWLRHEIATHVRLSK